MLNKFILDLVSIVTLLTAELCVFGSFNAVPIAHRKIFVEVKKNDVMPFVIVQSFVWCSGVLTCEMALLSVSMVQLLQNAIPAPPMSPVVLVGADPECSPLSHCCCSTVRSLVFKLQ